MQTPIVLLASCVSSATSTRLYLIVMAWVNAAGTIAALRQRRHLIARQAKMEQISRNAKETATTIQIAQMGSFASSVTTTSQCPVAQVQARKTGTIVPQVWTNF